jgi:tyrosyl-tRNA synthetase
MKATESLRSVRRLPFVCRSCLQRLRNDHGSPKSRPSEKRWITQVHIRRIQDAEEAWREQAAEIEAGNMKSMLSILEERGFVNQIVG